MEYLAAFLIGAAASAAVGLTFLIWGDDWKKAWTQRSAVRVEAKSVKEAREVRLYRLMVEGDVLLLTVELARIQHRRMLAIVLVVCAGIFGLLGSAVYGAFLGAVTVQAGLIFLTTAKHLKVIGEDIRARALADQPNPVDGG